MGSGSWSVGGVDSFNDSRQRRMSKEHGQTKLGTAQKDLRKMKRENPKPIQRLWGQSDEMKPVASTCEGSLRVPVREKKWAKHAAGSAKQCRGSACIETCGSFFAGR